MKKNTVLILILILYFPLLGNVAYSISIDKNESNQINQLKKKYLRPENIPHPVDNPYSKEKFELGKRLFFETRISRSNITSCASCHNPSLLWTDGLPVAVGDFHVLLTRKTQSIENLAWDELFFWDGRAESLEDQVITSITSTQEMNIDMSTAINKLNLIKGYKPFLKAAYHVDNFSEEIIRQTLATFMRELVSDIAPFDRWIEGEENAISESAKLGFLLFNKKANCASCHSSWRFSDGSFHDIGLNTTDIGRGVFLKNLILMQHAFKTSTLRNIALHAPYMHNGSLKSLEEVIKHYNDGFIQRESLSNEINKLNLTSEEQNHILNFLLTLTSEKKEVNVPVLPQ